jgi:hypothetical protein
MATRSAPLLSMLKLGMRHVGSMVGEIDG